MNTFTIEIEVPEGLRDLGFSDAEIRQTVPVLLVLKRFGQRAISSSKAAQILGMSRREFLDLLAREGVPLYDPTAEQLAEEIKTLKELASSDLK